MVNFYENENDDNSKANPPSAIHVNREGLLHSADSAPTTQDSSSRSRKVEENDRKILELIAAGRITPTPDGQILKPDGEPFYQGTCPNGYKRLRLWVEGRIFRFRVHRAILLHFRGLPGPGEECDHIDQNRSNNKLSNLRWVSRSVNCRQRGSNFTNRKLTNEQVAQIRELYSAGHSLGSISRRFGISNLTLKHRLTRDYSEVRNPPRVFFQGRPIMDLAREAGIKVDTARARYKQGRHPLTGEKLCAFS